MPQTSETRSSEAAYLRVEELDLDHWFQEQEVEVKAQIFMQWTLGKSACMPGLVGAIEERIIPIAGTIGDDKRSSEPAASDAPPPLNNFMGIAGNAK